VSKKLKTVVKQNDKNAQQDIPQSKATKTSARIETDGKHQLEGSELFSFFTANIIKEEKVFTR
jgi:hypothetical protein